MSDTENEQRKSQKYKDTISDPDTFLAEMRERFREAQTGLEHIHREATDDLRMVLNEDGFGQWDPAALAYRQSLKPPRPCLTQNMMVQFGNQVKNEQRKQRPQIKCNPVDERGDPATANIIAGLLRNQDYQSQAAAIYDMAFDSVVDCGIAAWRIKPVYADPMTSNQELRIFPIENPLSVLWDLSCKRFDTSDKRWTIVQETIPRKVAEKRFGTKEFSSNENTQGTSMAGWFMTDEVRIAEYWYIKEVEKTLVTLSNGKELEKDDKFLPQIMRLLKGVRIVDERRTTIPEIYSCICSGDTILDGPYWMPGQYIPIVLAFGAVVNHEGKRHYKSIHRDAKPTQQMHNYLISVMHEQFGLQPSVPWIGTAKMFEGREDLWARANEGGIQALTYNVDPSSPTGKPTREAPPVISQQLFHMIEQNLQNMRAVYGIYQAGLGMQSNETSGRAINARKSESDLGSFVYISNFLHALQFDGRIRTDLIPYYYDAPRAIMITGIENEQSKVLINQAFTVKGPDGKPRQIMYDLKTGKYGAVITIGPTATSQREETAQILSQIIQPIAQTNPLAGQILAIEQVKLLNTPNNDRTVKLLISTLPPAQQALMREGVGQGESPEVGQLKMQFDQQMQQAAQQLQMAGAEVEMLKQIVEASKGAIAEKESQLRAKDAEFDRLSADMALAKREIKLKADEAVIRAEQKSEALEAQVKAREAAEGELEQLRIEMGEIKQLLESLDRAIELEAKQDKGGGGNQQPPA